MARKPNKYKLPKIHLYDVEIVKQYNGTAVDPKALVAKIIGEKETFHIFILPNYEEKWVRFGCDSNTDFAQQVTQLMMESGEAQHLITQVYERCFGDNSFLPNEQQPDYTTFTYTPMS